MRYEEALKSCIFRFMSGSHAYGTNNEGSDEDFRGVFIAPLSKAFELFQTSFVGGGSIGYHLKEARDNLELSPASTKDHLEQAMLLDRGDLNFSVGTVSLPGNDEELQELRKFIKLAADCNPNIIEFLYVERGISVCTPAWEKIRAKRDLFLSKKARYTFSGYAIAQLRRIMTHRGYQMNTPPLRPTREEFGLPQETVVAKENQNAILSLPDKFVAPEARELVKAEKAYHQKLADWHAYDNWKKTRNAKRAELEAKYGYDCYLADTEFLTEQGWKLYDEISQNDKLATVFLGHHSHRRHLGIEYQPYIDRFDGLYSGPMYGLNGTHVDVCVTPNHRMLYRKIERASKKKYDIVLDEAATLPDTFEILVSPEPKVSTFSNLCYFDGIPIPQRAFMSLMGWYLSDGTMAFYNEKEKSVRISQKKGGRLSWHLSRWCSDHKHRASASLYDYDRTNAVGQQITERLLDVRDKNIVTKIFLECGACKNKRIPRWVFGLSKPLLERLFDAMSGGDGTWRNHKTKPTSIIYYSSLKGLADDVQELALLCGWEAARWGPYESETAFGKVMMYHVHVRKEAPRFKRLIRSKNVSKNEVKDQRIVCFTVPNGTLIIRRNGKIGIHGNSKHAGHLVRLIRMAKEILTEGVVKVYRPDREELLAIRNGAWSYERLVEYAGNIDEELNSLYEKSTLRNSADHKGIANLYLEVAEEAYGIKLR